MLIFDSVLFDKKNQTMTILNGTQGAYAYADIVSCKVLNENKRVHGKGEPFSATVPSGPLPSGMIFEKAVYVGVKVTLKDGHVLGIYTSSKPTRINTDVYRVARNEADHIKRIIDRIIEKNRRRDPSSGS